MRFHLDILKFMAFTDGIFDADYYFIFCNSEVLIKDEQSLPLPDKKAFSKILKAFPAARITGEKKYFANPAISWCAAVIENKDSIPENYKFIPLRSFFAEKDFNGDQAGKVSLRAKAVCSFALNFTFCPKCGKKLLNHDTESALSCPDCKNLIYPKIEPCIITLISKGDTVLRVRHTYRNQHMFACVAGFIEAGESAEDAVRREVMEETGLTVKNISYFKSQSWPFPAQLMLAFKAEYESGELTLQKEEIAEARWFTREQIIKDYEEGKNVPMPGSVAYSLLQDFIKNGVR